MDGQLVELEKGFDLPEGIQVNEFTTDEQPPLHANCRCTTIPYLEEFTKKIEPKEEIIEPQVKKTPEELLEELEEMIK